MLPDGTLVWFCKQCPCKKWLPVSGELCIDGFGLGNQDNDVEYSGLEDDQILISCPQQTQPSVKCIF